MRYSTKRVVIKPSHSYYNECDSLAFLSKNIYNCTLYLLREQYFINKTVLSYFQLYYLLRDKPDYLALPDKVSKGTIKQAQESFVSFTKLVKLFEKNRLNHKPRLPHYLHKTDGRFLVKYQKEAINRKNYKTTGSYRLSKTNLLIECRIPLELIVEIRIVKLNINYVIEIVYAKETTIVDGLTNYSAIDLGVNNLMSVTYSTGDAPTLYDGKDLKSYNRFYNKRKSYLQSKL